MKYTKAEKLILIKYILFIFVIFNSLLIINVSIFLEEGLWGYDKRFHLLPTIVSIIIGYLFTKNKFLNNRYLEEKNKAEKSLNEKKVLLREVHHRVKNNLLKKLLILRICMEKTFMIVKKKLSTYGVTKTRQHININIMPFPIQN